MKFYNSEEYRYLTPVNLTVVASNAVVYLVPEIIGDTQDAWFMFQHGAIYWILGKLLLQIFA